MSSKITPAFLKKLRADIDAALLAVGEKHGIDLNAGNASYNGDNFSFKLEGLVKGGKSVEAQTFEMHAHFYGLKPTDLGREFENSGQKYTIVGMNRGSKILCQRADNGKTYLFPAEGLGKYLSVAKQVA